MKQSLRLTLLLVAMMLTGFSARAGSITEEQAKAKAQIFLQSRHSLPAGKRLAPARTQKELRSTPKDKKALYVFNVGEQDGFVIVAGDDRARSILGYVDSGTFDASRIPAALNEMLDIYARQIEMLGQSKGKTDSISQSAARVQRRTSGVMADVTPLLTTTWDQGEPYNAYCPTLNDQTALTGCVATAMAQIAYYHKYPTSQVPSLASYISDTNKINVSAWGATTFDWDNMLDSYSGSYTNEQKKAVATLMRYCGQAAQMDYGFTSGAYNGDAVNAFTKRLGYNDNATFKSAASYSANGWEDLIYKEVRDGRPVYYSALNGNDGGPQCGGHAFVIDGYKSDGNYFHVNWGWGGACNGYFNLFALDPNAPESPITSTGWHYQMLALIGLSPEPVEYTTNLMKDVNGNWLITSADDWNELANNLDAYNGGSFKLTQDISVTTMVGTESQHFSGTFDGQGHTISVGYVVESFDSGRGQAPFSKIAGAMIKNLRTTGTITIGAAINDDINAAGIAGYAYGETSTIQNCWSSVNINAQDASGDVGIAGILGSQESQVIIADCLFDGSLTGPNTYWNGGFVGYVRGGDVTIVNSLQAGTFNTNTDHCGTFVGLEGEYKRIENCFFIHKYGESQGIAATTEQLADGTIARKLQDGQRDWTTGLVWGQLIGTDAVPVLTSDAGKAIYKVSFVVSGQVMKTIFTNNTLGDKMPAGEEFGLKNPTFTCNGSAFTSTTPITSDITVTVSGTNIYTLTLGTTDNGSISINNNNCMPGILKKITAVPANGYVVSSITVTDATGKELPVTPVSNNTNEYVFAFPNSSVTVNAEFSAGEAEPTRFINGGMTLPSSWRYKEQPWTADTWTIWNNDYQEILGTPPVDAMGHQWYEEGYVLTNSDSDVQPNGNKIVWENHTAPFGIWRNYDYARACGAGGDGPNNFYMRRVFTFNTQTVPSKLYLICYFDDAPVKIYLNGTLVYDNNSHDAGEYVGELTPEQIALIHTDGTPNVLAARCSQGWGDYYLDCGFYDPTALSYEVTGENTVRVLRNEFITGDVVIPETVTYNGVTYTVTEIEDDATNYCSYLSSLSLPRTITNVGTHVFIDLPNLRYVKSYVPIYQDWYNEFILLAAPLEATEYEVDKGCTGIWDKAFEFTENLTKLTLPRTLTYIGYTDAVFKGSKALTEIYSYARPAPRLIENPLEGMNKSAITMHVYASALDSYKQLWGEEFNYITMPDPQTVTLTINVTDMGSLRALIEAAVTEKNTTIYDVTGITVTGTINQDDLSTLADMCTGVYSLSTIDLSGANIEGNYIGGDRFSSREKLTSIILPETLEYIEGSAFRYCNGLTSIDIPASVKRIAEWAFDCCENLATVTGMEGLSEINCWSDWDPFYGTAITQPVYGGSVFLYMPPTITGDYEMPAGIKMTAPGAIRNSQISSIILPASLTDLGDDTFANCRNLSDIYCYASTPPACISGVWENGFDRSACTVHVPASAVEDYQNAGEWNEMGQIVPIFSGNEVVVKNGVLMYVPASTEGVFTIPEGVVEIADNAFDNCTLITKLIIGSEVKLNNKSLKGLSDVVEIVACQDIYLDQTLYAIGNTTTNYVIPKGCAVIHPYAFKNSTALSSLTTQSIVVIEPQENALAGLSSSVTIYVYESMLEDYKQIWGANHNYQTIPAPEIGGKAIAFTSADGLWAEAAGVWTSQNHNDDSSAEITASLSVTAGETIVLDWSVSSEGGYDWLRGYWNDEEILGETGVNSGTLAYTFKNTGSGTLRFVYSKDGSDNANDDCATIGFSQSIQIGSYTLKIGNDNVSVVATTLTGDIMMPASFRILGKTYPVVAFEKSLFSENKQITSVTLPSTITAIPASAFSGCANLSNIIIGDNVKRIGSYAFAGSGITSITIPDAVTEMGDRGVQNCGALTSITIGNGLTYVPECWAEFCNNLEEVTIGKKMTSLGWRAFRGTNIKNVYCYSKNPPSWNDSFYDGIHADATLHVYSNCVDRYKNAGGWNEFHTIVGDLGSYTTYELTVNVTEMGTFSDALATAMTNAGIEDMVDISKLTVTGSMNMDDLYYLRDNLGAYLETLDLGAVTMQDNTFGYYALSYCEFEELILPASLEYLRGEYALEGCKNLKSLIIPSTVKEIGSRTLGGTTALEAVTIGKKMTGIGWRAFCGTHIKDFYCHAKTPPSWDSDIFAEGDYPEVLHVYSNCVNRYKNANGWKNFPTIKGDLGTYPSYELTVNATEMGTFGDALATAMATIECTDMTEIGKLTVTGSVNFGDLLYLRDNLGRTLDALDLGDVTVEDNSLYHNQLSGCGFEELILPANLKSLDRDNILRDCSYLKTIHIPSGVWVIGKNILNGATALETVTGGEGVKEAWGEGFFNNCPNLKSPVILGNIFFRLPQNHEGTYKVPEHVTDIAGSAFSGCSSLTNITLPTALKTIGGYAFEYTGLTNVTIPENVTWIGEECFGHCSSLTRITTGNKLAEIPNRLTEFCDNLEEVTLGKRVSRINWRAFRGTNIKHVYCYAKNPPVWNNADSFYDGINPQAVLHVHSNCVESYQNAEGWKDFHNIVSDLGEYITYDIAVNVPSFGGLSEALATAIADAGCTDVIDISKLTVTGRINHDDLNYIRYEMGGSLDALDLSAVTVEGNVLGDGALAYCRFSEILLPNNIEVLQGWHVLQGCENLKTINIPSRVRYIGPYTLYGATALETVTGGENVNSIDSGSGFYFNNCPNLQSPVILGNIMFRLPEETEGSYEMPENVTTIAPDAMRDIPELTTLTLSENITEIWSGAVANDAKLKDIYFYAVEIPSTRDDSFHSFDRSGCTLHVYAEMAEVFQNNEIWSEFNIVGDLGPMPIIIPMNEDDFAALCNIYNTLGGNSWKNKWLTKKNARSVSRWRGVTFDEDGYVTSIDLSGNRLSGDVGELTFTGFTRLTSMNLSSNTLTGDVSVLKGLLPTRCVLNVELQELGDLGEHTLYEICQLSEGLPTIALYSSWSGRVSTLMGVGGECQFYCVDTEVNNYWDGGIRADGSTWSNGIFRWPSSSTVECTYPHHFTFTYNYEMGDANMDDALNVLDLQSTLNYSNGQQWGLFNFYAADTYGTDKDINVQDIVSTVNILLAHEESESRRLYVKGARSEGNNLQSEHEAYVSVRNGQVVLYTTKPVAALDLRIAGIMPDKLHWNTEMMGFATATTAQNGGTHAIIYSMQPRQIEEGLTVLATYDAHLSPNITSVILSDSKARPISVSNSLPTGITSIQNSQSTTDNSVYDLQGRKVNGKQKKGMYIENGRKVVIK